MASLRKRLDGSAPEVRPARLTATVAETRSGSDTLFRARYGCYLVLGFDREQAFFLAMTPEVGIVEALRLLESDCPHETALAILV